MHVQLTVETSLGSGSSGMIIGFTDIKFDRLLAAGEDVLTGCTTGAAGLAVVGM